MSEQLFHVNAVYQFLDLDSENLPKYQENLKELARKWNIKGLLILAQEGLNGTYSGSESDLVNFSEGLSELFGFSDWQLKESVASKKPFKKFAVRIREEICTSGGYKLLEGEIENSKLSPETWKEVLENEDVLLVDTRNYYETEIGKFKNALDLNLVNFGEFPGKIKEANLPKEKKLLMYCTGGIRCEKAYSALREQGFENVFQLQGGILNYFEKFGGDHYEGECFVFDRRVAVKPNLEPTDRYEFCVLCGQPGEIKCNCQKCSKGICLCEKCVKNGSCKSCFKNSKGLEGQKVLA